MPEPKETADDKIYLKAPDVLKATNNKARTPDLLQSDSNTEGVFYTDRDSTSARQRVDFDLDSSQDLEASSSFVQSNILQGESLNDRLLRRIEKDPKLKKLSASSQSVTTDQQGGMLRRLVRSLNESSLDVDAHSRLMDKTLSEFPIFALNDDYLKALSLILQDKMDFVKRAIDEQVWRSSSPDRPREDEEAELMAPRGQYLPRHGPTDEQDEDMMYGLEKQQENYFPKSAHLQEAEDALVNHKFVDDQEQLNNWYRKQQQRMEQLDAIGRLVNAIQVNMLQRRVQGSFEQLLGYDAHLRSTGRRLEEKMAYAVHRKVFYRWFNGYFMSLEHTYRPYSSTLKRKVM